MADPQVIQCTGDCTVHVVHEFSFPVLNLTVDDGHQIAGAILSVWAVAWGIRQVIKLLQSSDAHASKESE